MKRAGELSRACSLYGDKAKLLSIALLRRDRALILAVVKTLEAEPGQNANFGSGPSEPLRPTVRPGARLPRQAAWSIGRSNAP